MRPVAAIPAEEDLGILSLDDPRAPQRGVTVQQAASREMPRGCTCERQTGKGDFIPPVKLTNTLPADAPPLQVSPDTERHDEHGGFLLQLSDRSIIEMVIMIMREQHGINRRKISQLNRQLPAVPLAAYEWKG
ncbi:hypothetical protein D3C75_786920 [compost metagenome]